MTRRARGAVALMLLAGSLCAAPLHAQDACGEREPAPGLLVSADWLRRHRTDSNLVILQAERTRASYDSLHIPGARFIAWSDYVVRNGELITELPSVPALDSLFESLGIGDRTRIVIYGEVQPVTRLFFTLDYLGLGDRVSVLNGGRAAWAAAGGPVNAIVPKGAQSGSLTPHPRPEVLADAGYIESHRNAAGMLLLDARTEEEFDGTRAEEGVARAGHIPGAVRLEWGTMLEEGKFLDKGELRLLFGSAGAAPGKEIVTYCRVGSRATVLYFAARVLGYPVRLYDGSMNDWASRAERAVVGRSP